MEAKRRKSKLFWQVALVASVLGSVVSPAAAAPSEPAYRMEVEGQDVTDGLPFTVDNGVTWVPVRKAAELLHATVRWSDGLVTVRRGRTTLEFQVGSARATVGDRTYDLPGQVRLIGDFTYVPLRFLAERLGYDVIWDGDGQKIVVKPSEQRQQERDRILEILRKQAEVSNGLTSYGMDMHLAVQGKGPVEEGGSFRVEGNFHMLYQREPLAMAAQGQLSATGLPGLTGPVSLEAYLADDKVYFRDPNRDQWYFIPVDLAVVKEWMSKGTDTPEQRQIETWTADGAELVDQGDAYVIAVDWDRAAMQRILDLLAKSSEEPFALPPVPEGPEMSVYYEWAVEKDSFYPRSMHMVERITPVPGAELEVDLDGTVNQVNNVPPVAVPDAVKQKAVPLGVPGVPGSSGQSVPIP
ncbi:MAG: copper amine oxidase N-terminal domain-containing protein [Alicyclobacillaceae bacterium]|nr:copper amine oxidase N-terminal domain-containing protein [Alicyclobacillaceae bacterium]